MINVENARNGAEPFGELEVSIIPNHHRERDLEIPPCTKNLRYGGILKLIFGHFGGGEIPLHRPYIHTYSFYRF